MKNILFAIIAILISVTLTPITAHAESFAEKCQRMQRENDEAYIKGLQADGNLSQDALDAYKGKSKLKPNKKKTTESTKNNSTESTSTYSGLGGGWVADGDELHVIGLPSDERGYTRAGYYGEVKNH